MLPKASYAPDESVIGEFNTFDPSTGAPITLAGSPSLRLNRYRSAVWSEITGAGITLRVDEDDTGRHEYEIDLDDANISAADGDEYTIAINVGTVDGNSVVGVVIDRFTVAAAGLTTDQITDVESSVWDADLSLYVTADTAGEALNDLISRITSTLFSGITSLAEWLGLIAGKQTGDSTARTEIRATGAGSGTYDETTDSQEAIAAEGGTRSIPEKGAAFTFTFKMVDATDFVTAEPGKAVANQISKDGGAFATGGGPVTEISNGWYQYAATTGDMSANRLIFRFTAAGCAPTEIPITTDGGV